MILHSMHVVDIHDERIVGVAMIHTFVEVCEKQALHWNVHGTHNIPRDVIVIREALSQCEITCRVVIEGSYKGF